MTSHEEGFKLFTAMADEEDEPVAKHPFVVGQKVICISKVHHRLNHGEVYTISGLLTCPNRVQLREFRPRDRFLATRFKSVTDMETTNYSISEIEPAAPTDPIEDWHDRARNKAFHRNPHWSQSDEPDPEPKKGPDLTGIQRAVDNMTQDGLILAARRGTEGKP